MIGVEEELLNLFLLTHGLLLLSSLCLALLFSVFLCVRHHPAFRDQFRHLPPFLHTWLDRGDPSPQPLQEVPSRRRRMLGWLK